jgi:hypothetical protein
MFDGIENAKSGDRLPRLGFGCHLVEILTVKGITKISGKGTALITRYKVIESGNAADPVGAERDYYQEINTFSLGYLVRYAAACLGVDPNDSNAVDAQVRPIVKKTLDAAISSDQVFRGVRLKVQVDPKPDKDIKDKIHANHTFYPAPAAA